MPRQPTHTSALRAALEDVKLKPADGAAVRLAYGYAKELDKTACGECGGPEPISKVGPLLLATLTALGMTPAGRAGVTGKGVTSDTPAGVSPLDELRQRRTARGNTA